MRIAIDIQGIQSDGSRVRGIGRYSYELIVHMIKYHPEIEFILVANGALRNIRYKFKKELDQKNVLYFEWFSPCPIDNKSRSEGKFILGKYIRSYTFSVLNVDVVIISSFLEGFSDNCLTELDFDIFDLKVVSIFYDLIPFLNPDLYLNSNPEFAYFYKTKLAGLKKLDGLLAISESSRNEVIDHLKFDSNKAFNISSACDKEKFCVSEKKDYPTQINYDQFTPFLLYVGASDPRKNLKNLLNAYSQLPTQLNHFNLVLAGKLLQPEIELIDIWIDFYNIDKTKVKKIGYVSDNDLVTLYRKCSLFVFPSLHEGFGLPILEAMSCGAPVIGSNCTSIPEIIGIQKAMFDPTSIEKLRDLIIKALSDNKYKEELLINSSIQSNKFSWRNTAEKAIAACTEISNNKKIINKSLLWKQLINDRNQKFNNLIQAINANRTFRNKFDDKTWSLIASSLDKINMQVDSVYRSLYKSETISSWRVEGPFDSSYSLAILNRYFVKALNNSIDNLTLHVTEGLGDYEPDIAYLKKFSFIYETYKKSIKFDTISEVVSRNLYPPRVDDLISKYNLIHSYGWEESEFPKKWVNDFNSNLQGITVMSNQVKKILIDNGVKIPIATAGLGLDHIDDIKADHKLNINVGKYKILHISSCFNRKGIDVLLQAYAKAFTKNDDVSLIIKTFVNPHNKVDDLLQSYQKDNPSFPHVLVITNDLTDSQLKGLYMQANLLVAPSRGEGFGLPIGEAMRLGLPVITTGWGGQLDFVNNNNSWLIDYKFSASESHFDLDQSYWAEPSINHLTQLLLEVFSSSDSEILLKTQAAKELTRSLTWDSVAKKNIDFVQNKLGVYDNSFLKLGCISTWNTKCGIASYTKNLLENFNDELIVFSPYNEDLSLDNDIQVIPSWYYGKANNCGTLIKEIKENQINTVLIQFNYGFFDFSDLSDLIFNLKKNSIYVIILLHSTKDPEDNKTKLLSNLSKALKSCARILVHSIDDLNRLKKLNLIDNVCLFPHGIIDYEFNDKTCKPLVRGSTIKTISTFGFCLPNKGYEELINAVSILRNRGLDIRLNIFSAIYSDDYYWFYEKLVSLVHDLNLVDYILIDNRYLDPKEILDNLSLSDCLVFPYQKSNESSSASIRVGLATLKPTFVTPLEIFNDVSGLVNYMSGFSPQDIANSIFDYFDETKNIAVKLDSYDKKNFQLIQNRRFSKVSMRLRSMLQSIVINGSK